MVVVQSLLEGSGYLDPDTLAMVQRAYDEVWRECPIDFENSDKLNAARAYVARAILAAYERDIEFERLCASGREALARLRRTP